ncbi:hypothetical protein NMY22_g13301 [Coprinellus aureogranulatus]|nr:hypothetical protein NMY22_g13301 [Coprinellus aureogranulatus]
MDVVKIPTHSSISEPGDQESGVDRISDLPLDILREVPSFGLQLMTDSDSDPPCFKIFSSLHPTAILRLAQTCKAFRKYLMNRSLARASVWVPALEAVDCLPPCPKELSEPRYTYLMWYARCDDCLSRDAEKIVQFYMTHQMLCFDCIPKHFATFSNLPGTSEKRIGRLLTAWTVPSVYISNVNLFGQEPVFHIASVKKLVEEIKAIDPEDQDKIDSLKARWEEFVDMRTRHTGLCAKFTEHEARVYSATKKVRKQQLIERMSAKGYPDECRSFFAEYTPSGERQAKRKLFKRTLDQYIHFHENQDLSDQGMSQSFFCTHKSTKRGLSQNGGSWRLKLCHSWKMNAHTSLKGGE